jgi:uncharacterized protein
MAEVIFHVAFPVGNLVDTKAFYADGLGCEVGRESVNSVILKLYGHQLVAHVMEEPLEVQRGIYPRHFGLIFTEEAAYDALLLRAEAKQLPFYIEHKRRFPGQITEHRTFFLADPFQNLLEFKFYAHYEAIFSAREFGQIGDRQETLV